MSKIFLGTDGINEKLARALHEALARKVTVKPMTKKQELELYQEAANEEDDEQ